VDSILSQFKGWDATYQSTSDESDSALGDAVSTIAEDEPIDTNLVDELIVDLADELL
jgi:hypothetical protein